MSGGGHYQVGGPRSTLHATFDKCCCHQSANGEHSSCISFICQVISASACIVWNCRCYFPLQETQEGPRNREAAIRFGKNLRSAEHSNVLACPLAHAWPTWMVLHSSLGTPCCSHLHPSRLDSASSAVPCRNTLLNISIGQFLPQYLYWLAGC